MALEREVKSGIYTLRVHRPNQRDHLLVPEHIRIQVPNFSNLSALPFATSLFSTEFGLVNSYMMVCRAAWFGRGACYDR